MTIIVWRMLSKAMISSVSMKAQTGMSRPAFGSGSFSNMPTAS